MGWSWVEERNRILFSFVQVGPRINVQFAPGPQATPILIFEAADGSLFIFLYPFTSFHIFLPLFLLGN